MPRRQQNKLTDRKIRSLVKAGGPAAISDGAGLTLTISATGYVAWVLRYRFGGRQKEYTIGAFSDVSLERARKRRDELREMLDEGTDPAKHKKAQQAVAVHSHNKPDTFADLTTEWFDQTQKNRLKNPQVVERVLRRYLIPELGDLALADIRPTHVIACLQKIIDRGAPTVANDARRHMRIIFDYGIVIGEMDSNPAGKITHAIVGHDEAARTRKLSLPEIRKLMLAMEKARAWFGRDNELTIRLLLLLGVRKMDLLGARWGEFDLDGKHPTWTIPKVRIKTRRKGNPQDFVIPLPRQAVELLRELEVRACGSEWVLPARRRGSRNRGHVGPDTVNMVLKDLETGLPHFTVHDLRRSFRSGLSAVGTEFSAAERSLNHKLPGQAEIYDRHDFLKQRRAALQRWADALEVLEFEGVKGAKDFIGGLQVVELRRMA